MILLSFKGSLALWIAIDSVDHFLCMELIRNWAQPRQLAIWLCLQSCHHHNHPRIATCQHLQCIHGEAACQNRALIAILASVRHGGLAKRRKGVKMKTNLGADEDEPSRVPEIATSGSKSRCGAKIDLPASRDPPQSQHMLTWQDYLLYLEPTGIRNEYLVRL